MTNGWFGKLKEIIKINIKNSFNIIIVNKPDIDQKSILSDKNKTVELNYPKLTGEERKLLGSSLRKGIKDKELNLLETDSNERVKDIKEKFNLKCNKDILDFYRGKISPEHYKALEASLYARSYFKLGQSILDMKKDIRNKFGEDGNNICNLCTTGYFEGYIKEAYEEMQSSPDFSIIKWQDYFQIIVRTSPFAIFVHKEMSENELSGKILFRLKTYKKYSYETLIIWETELKDLNEVEDKILEFNGGK